MIADYWYFFMFDEYCGLIFYIIFNFIIIILN